MGLFDGNGANGYGGILGQFLQNQYDEKKYKVMADAMKELGTARDDQSRMNVMAAYASQGYNPNDLRMFNQTQRPYQNYERVGDSIIDLNTMRPVYTAPQAPQRPDYSHLREVGGSLIDLRTGQPVYTAPQKEELYKLPNNFGSDVRSYVDERRGVLRDNNGGFIEGSTNPLDPSVEDEIARRASEYYQRTGNQEIAKQQAFQDVVGDRPLKMSKDTGIDKPGLFTGNYEYMKPKATVDSQTKEGRQYNEGMTATLPDGTNVIFKNGNWIKK